MRSLSRFSRALSDLLPRVDDGSCEVCRQPNAPFVPPDDGSVAVAVIIVRPICQECYEDCLEVFKKAQSVLNAAPAQSCSVPCLWMVAKRVALMRALPELVLKRREPQYCPCSWCFNPIFVRGGPVLHLTDDWEARRPEDKIGLPMNYWLHDKCHGKINGVLHRTHVTRCMASGAMRLPLLPELQRRVALFVVQAMAVGLEAAAVDYCLT